ncbi:TVP38/TMEM64 family protein [Pistricoccus aurantiacus]|uniref:TVP38/TMEM64 family membrane protein n=1 Tax=Pistricoccus aurantiacus TaxID=1883414 RepID=A0A5B8SVF7_9GAMM|nr:TVP38/TMEM64 family protein [Pistricoccus aurantiacus]QEA40746.1 TVP38/TMEM64 family protein [Pistricoccus aurantiacus]
MSRPLGILIAALVVLVGLGLMWQWLSMQDLLNVQVLLDLVNNIADWRDAPWAILAVMATYALASLVIFPLSLLVALTGLLFGPWWGFGYALAGTMAASVLNYWVGRKLGRDALLAYGGKRLKGLSRYLSGRGIRTMVVINLLPLAPFTLTNMMAGAFHLKFRDYLIGSVLGIAPGIVGVTLLGSQLGNLVSADSQRELLMALGGILLAVLVLFLAKRYADRRQRKGRH